MAVLPVIVAPDSRLLLCSEEVSVVDNEVRKLVDDMFETMYHKRGLGLAAVQVGVHKRIFVADVPKEYGNTEGNQEYEAFGGPFCIINPKIDELSDEKIDLDEGCLSLPGESSMISRPRYMTMRYLDKNGNERVIKARDWLARCFEHEIDHLNGILFVKYLSKLKRDMIMEKVKKIS